MTRRKWMFHRQKLSPVSCFLQHSISSQLLKGLTPPGWVHPRVLLHNPTTALLCPERAPSSSTCQSDLGGGVKTKLRMKKRLIITPSKGSTLKEYLGWELVSTWRCQEAGGRSAQTCVCAGRCAQHTGSRMIFGSIH